MARCSRNPRSQAMEIDPGVFAMASSTLSTREPNLAETGGSRVADSDFPYARARTTHQLAGTDRSAICALEAGLQSRCGFSAGRDVRSHRGAICSTKGKWLGDQWASVSLSA